MKGGEKKMNKIASGVLASIVFLVSAGSALAYTMPTAPTPPPTKTCVIGGVVFKNVPLNVVCPVVPTAPTPPVAPTPPTAPTPPVLTITPPVAPTPPARPTPPVFHW
jgi:hypothetical protein